MTDTVTAALYLRSAAINDNAIADQRARCTAQMITAGYSLGDVFVDNGVGSLGDRPGLAALRAYVEQGRAQVVLVTDPARIARDVETVTEQERFFERHGVKLVYVDLPDGHAPAVGERSIDVVPHHWRL